MHCASDGVGPAAEEVLREDALEVQREVERLLPHPDRVVGLLAEDDVRPAVAGAVPQLDLRLHRRRAVAVAVEGDDVQRDVRMRLGVQLRHRQADGVDPDGDRAGGAWRWRRLRRSSRQTSAASGRRDERSEHEPPTVDLHAAPPPSFRARLTVGQLTGRARCSCTKSGSAMPGLGRGVHETVRPDARLAHRPGWT